MIKEILAGICFIFILFGLVGATAFVEPLNQAIIEARDK